MAVPHVFRFYRTIMNDKGRPFESTVELITISRAKTEERARRAAVLRFVRHQQLSRWDCLATGYEQLRPQMQTAT